MTLKATLGMLALFSASAGIAAPSAGTEGATPQTDVVVQAAVLPSIEILTKQLNLAGRCNGSTFDLNTFINTTAQTSARVQVSSSAVNPSLLEQFTDNTGANVGVFNDDYPNFHILGFGGGLAPNTPITIAIATYTGPNLTGAVTFTSTITFNCTTGQISRLARDPPVQTSVPALGFSGLALLAMLLGLAGSVAASRSRRAAKRIGGTGRGEHAGSAAGVAPQRQNAGRRLPVEADQRQVGRAAPRQRDFAELRAADGRVGAAGASATHDAVPHADPIRAQQR